MRRKHRLHTYLAGFSKHPLRFAKLELLVQKVAGWRILAKTSSGYPLNQAPVSALGPIISHFLPAAIESGWATSKDGRIPLSSLSLAEHRSFAAISTTGSTMNNRAGLHTALMQIRDALFFYSDTLQHQKSCPGQRQINRSLDFRETPKPESKILGTQTVHRVGLGGKT